MRGDTLPKVHDLVFLGGGHTHALVLRKWGMKPVRGVRVTLINPAPTAPYTGMLPGYVAGHYDRESLDIDLVRLARFAGARLVIGSADGIDLAARTVHLADRPPIAYDTLSIDIGITSDLPSLPGFSEHAVAAKPLGAFSRAWQRFVDTVRRDDRRPDIVVIGGGVAGVELALAMAHRLESQATPGRITIIEAQTALGDLGARSREILLQKLADFGIDLRENVAAERIEAAGVHLTNGGYLDADFVVGTAGARPHDWLAETGLPLTDGFITVNADLKVRDLASVFAAGDCIHLAHAPRPKAGVYAVRAAPILYRNLKAHLTEWPLKTFEPQRDYLKLISLGGKAALADKYRIAWHGAWLWRVKDGIDRRFMDRFTDLPPFDPPAPPTGDDIAAGVRREIGDGRPLCGGCGAKVGPVALTTALADLPDVADGAADGATELGAGDDAAILKIGDRRQVVSTDHLRAFTEDPYLMGRIAARHALGDIWAMGAEPQAALATLILPPLSESLQQRTVREILAGARSALDPAGAALVGGHTTAGPELTVGFTVTGMADRDPIRLAGARPGDGLILTEPLGSGAVLAAEMTWEADGPAVAACLETMQREQGTAARLLAPHAHAITDVTGFGLAGHLLGMLRRSGVAAEIELDAVPTLPGAAALLRRGVRSSLHDANRRQAEGLGVPDDPRAEILFDPQTAGGLLAAVPADAVDPCLSRLAAAGYPAVRIGTIVAAGSTPSIEVR